MFTFSTQSTLFQTLTNNTSSVNSTFAETFINQYTLELVHRFPSIFSENTYYLQTFPGQQFYTLPTKMRKINTIVINVGNVQGTTTTGAGFNWPVKECPSMEYWNEINMVNNITSDIPLYDFFYNGQVGIYPKPANGYNPITIRGQGEVTLVSQSDYTTGTIVAVPYVQTLTAIPTLGATTATMTGAWTLPTGTYQISFSDGEMILASMTLNSTIMDLQHPIIGTPNYPLAFTTTPTAGTTSLTLTTNFTLATGTYQMTFSDNEIIVATLTNGSTAVTLATAITGTPDSVATINNSTGGNVVNISTSINIQTAQGGDIVTGSGTTWIASMVGYVFCITQPTGDGFWYTINQVYNPTTLALSTAYTGTAIAAGSAAYTIGQASIIPPAYQLIPVYRTLELYYTVVLKDPQRQDQYKKLGDSLMAAMEEDYGAKTTDPTCNDDFGDLAVPNPNLYIQLTDSH